jgi:hypothetical protein
MTEIIVLNNKKSSIVFEDTGKTISVLAKTELVLSNLRGPQGASWQETYESVSKNLKGIPFSLEYSSGELSRVVYENGIIKTLNRTSGKVTSIVLSGNTPQGIALTKTLTYSGDMLVAISYSGGA